MNTRIHTDAMSQKAREIADLRLALGQITPQEHNSVLAALGQGGQDTNAPVALSQAPSEVERALEWARLEPVPMPVRWQKSGVLAACYGLAFVAGIMLMLICQRPYEVARIEQGRKSPGPFERAAGFVRTPEKMPTEADRQKELAKLSQLRVLHGIGSVFAILAMGAFIKGSSSIYGTLRFGSAEHWKAVKKYKAWAKGA